MAAIRAPKSGDALVDALLGAGIEPFVTLNHWDMPAELMDHGDWASRDTVAAFVEYAEAVTGRLAKIDKPIKVAVMGCPVNGPEDDFGQPTPEAISAEDPGTFLV